MNMYIFLKISCCPLPRRMCSYGNFKIDDPKHTCKKTKKYFKDHKVSVIPWPSQSPDLNPIENLWRDLKIAVFKHKVRNQKELWEIIQREWILIERCRKLVESMPRRCEAVIKNRGHATKY